MVRTVRSTQGFELIRDEHSGRGAEVCFLKRPERSETTSFVVLPTYELEERVADEVIGTLLHGTDGEGAVTLWFPRGPEQCSFDEHGRPGPTRSRDAGSWLETDGGRLRLLVAGDAGAEQGATVVPFVRMSDPHRAYFRELSDFSEEERRRFKVSEWFRSSSVASIWDYLVDGDLYDPRASHTTGARFRCQQCAGAWWHYLQSLGAVTGKSIYGLLRDEVAGSVLSAMDPDGGWRHGFWWEGMETHARFQLDGIDLLLLQHEVTGEERWLQGARRGMQYVLDQLTDPLDDGLLWFLHDTMEGERNHRIRSTWLGKDPGNSLCLNTHMQALKVLHRLYERDPEEEVLGRAYGGGMAALRRVLDHQPADTVYGPLVRGILDEKVPIPRAQVVRRARRRLLKRLKRRLYWYMQARYPRVTHPNGFIERDLSLSCGSDRYHVTNLKDLLKLYELTGHDWLRDHIVRAFGFLREYLARRGLEDALRASPYYIEVVDIMVLYSRLVETLPSEEIDAVRTGVRRATGADTLEGELSWTLPAGRS